MKSLICIAFSLWAFSGVATTIEINEALKLGKIKAVPTYKKLGNKGISLKISNVSNQPLTVSIPGGTTFSPGGNEEQVLMNIEEVQLVLNGGETKSVLVGEVTVPSSVNWFHVWKTALRLEKHPIRCCCRFWNF